MRETTNKIRKTTNKTFAIHAAVPAIPPNPRTPAMIATSRNPNAHDNIIYRSLLMPGKFIL
jgi:hypothetical protein